MDKYLKNPDGSVKMDDDGNPIPNPNYIEPTGFEMTPEIEAYVEQRVSTLMRSNATAQNALATVNKRAETAEAKLTTAETELTELREKISSGDFDIEPKERVQLQTHADNIAKERDTLQSQNTSLKAELHKYKVVGRLERASNGVFKKHLVTVGMNQLNTMVKETDSGELECIMPDGRPALDASGQPMSVEDFVSNVFTREYPDLCVADSALPNSQGPKPGTKPAGENPFAKETMNRSAQGPILKNNPALARQYMQEAGYSQTKIDRLLS